MNVARDEHNFPSKLQKLKHHFQLKRNGCIKTDGNTVGNMDFINTV